MEVSAKLVNAKPEFEPIKVEITLNSLKEAQMFYNLFNLCVLTDYTQFAINNVKIRSSIDKVCPGAGNGDTEDFLKSIAKHGNWNSRKNYFNF